jgi:RNA polymerase sigma-70 factor (ECF subfamily)
MMTAVPATTAMYQADVVGRARKGDPGAWQQIVSELGPVIRGYARARGVPDPDDLTQDVFAAAAQRLGDFRGDWAAFRSWMFAIAYRQVVNRYRQTSRATAQLPDGLATAAPGPEEEVLSRIAADSAVAALEVLEPLERDVILMRVLGGLDAAAVGRAVGKRPGNVRVIQFRAMAKLREELIRRGYGAEEAHE